MSYRISPEQGFSDYYFCREIYDPTYVLHVHSHIEFVFVLEGTLQATIESKPYTFHAGQIAVAMPFEPHAYTGQARLFVLACPPDYLTEYRQLLTGKVFSPPYASFNEAHAAIMSDIIKDGFQDDFKKKALLYYAVSTLLRDSTLQDASIFEFDVYRKALMYISQNFRENITLKTTAVYVGVTQSHLSHVLNSSGKPGFTDILNSLRAYAARDLLLQNTMSVSEVALAVGFGSIRNFNRIFKKHFQCSPTDLQT